MNTVKTKKKTRVISLDKRHHVQFQLNQISPTLRVFSWKLTESESESQDLYQDTALRIITNANKYKVGTNFKAWALTIMRNIFINNYRKKKRRGYLVGPTLNDYYINSGKQTIKNNGESTLAYKELLKMVSRLPEKTKQPFWMSYSGYKYQEIAEKLDLPLGTIKSRIFFARQNLQQMYGQKVQL